MSRALEAQGFLVMAIRPPTVPAGTARLRVTLSAAHEEAQVDALVAALRRRWPHEPPDPREIFALDRRAVSQAFDRASASYDAAAALQERVRNELLARLDELKIAPRSILDLGAGTGHAIARAEAALSERRWWSRRTSRPACWSVRGSSRAGCGVSSGCAPTPMRCRFVTAPSI